MITLNFDLENPSNCNYKIRLKFSGVLSFLYDIFVIPQKELKCLNKLTFINFLSC